MLDVWDAGVRLFFTFLIVLHFLRGVESLLVDNSLGPESSSLLVSDDSRSLRFCEFGCISEFGIMVAVLESESLSERRRQICCEADSGELSLSSEAGSSSLVKEVDAGGSVYFIVGVGTGATDIMADLPCLTLLGGGWL